VREDAGEQAPGRSGEGGDRQRPGDGAAVCGETGLYPLDAGQQVAGVAGQQCTNIGQSNTPALTLDQQLPDLAFQPRHLL